MERIRQAVIIVDTATEGLVEVAGLSLIKHALLTLGRAGLTRADVVCREGRDELAAALAADPAYHRHGVVVTVAAALPAVPGPVVVLTADHVFDAAVVKVTLAAAAAAAPGKVVRCVRGPDEPCALVVGGDELVAALREADLEVEAALVALAADGRVEDADLGDLLCVRADTAAGRAAAQAALLRSLTKPTDGWVARHLNRRVSKVVATRALLGTSVTPDQIETLVANALGFLGVALVARCTWWTLLAGAALVQLLQ